MPSAKSTMSRYQTWDGSGSMTIRSSSSSSTGFSPSMPVSLVQNDHFARLWVDQPPMLEVGLVRQSGGDLLNVDSIQLDHPVSVGLLPVDAQPVTLGPAAQLAAV